MTTEKQTYYQRNKETIKAKSKLRYQHNRDKIILQSKLWYQCNKKKIAEYNKRRKQLLKKTPEFKIKRRLERRTHYWKHREQILAKKREKRKASPAKSRLKQYNLSIEAYNSMLRSQNECCKICNKPSKYGLCIDHDHKSGKVRGLLCNRCNLGVGHFYDDIQTLENAVLYLKQHIN